VVVFGGEIHAATTVRKVDSTGPAAFASPTAGAIGRVVEHRVWLHSRPLRPRAIDPLRLEHRVGIVTASLGDDGALLRQAAEDADGLVVVGFGAGHLTPGMLRELCTAVESVPVLITCRPDRSSMLFSTYGFEGSERDLRATGAVCVPFLSAVAARVVLLACLGAGVGTDQLGSWLAPWDAR
jgi:L-asparaginase